jgi:serine/threonine protein kinase
MAPELFTVVGDTGIDTFHCASTSMSTDIYSLGLLVLEVCFPTLNHSKRYNQNPGFNN